MTNSPIAVVISDIHYSLATLELADEALNAAIKKSIVLDVPLIIAGDLTDTKAIIRAEVANRLIDTLDWYSENGYHRPKILVGNHDLINEKGAENALHFLRHYADIISTPLDYLGFSFIPYQSSNEAFLKALHEMPTDQIVIAHQGFKGANMGDYIQDTSSVDPKDCGDYRIISGHYHRHQTLGNITYVGNPYTLTFGEANDGPKGYLVLYEDGSVTREILKLRKHVIVNFDATPLDMNYIVSSNHNPGDLLWVKASGPQSVLNMIKKETFGFGHTNFRLDLIPTDSKTVTYDSKLSDSDQLDKLIDSLSESEEYKKYLKGYWRDFT